MMGLALLLGGPLSCGLGFGVDPPSMSEGSADSPGSDDGGKGAAGGIEMGGSAPPDSTGEASEGGEGGSSTGGMGDSGAGGSSTGGMGDTGAGGSSSSGGAPGTGAGS